MPIGQRDIMRKWRIDTSGDWQPFIWNKTGASAGFYITFQVNYFGTVYVEFSSSVKDKVGLRHDQMRIEMGFNIL